MQDLNIDEEILIFAKPSKRKFQRDLQIIDDLMLQWKEIHMDTTFLEEKRREVEKKLQQF